MTTRPWQALLHEDLATQARQIALEIALALEQLPVSPLPGLKGEAATALLLSHCERATSYARLEEALSNAVEQPTPIALFGGLAGTSWVLEHMVEHDDAEPVLAHFDSALIQYLEVARWEDRLDLVSGLAGIGVSVAARRDARAMRIANLVVSHLEATAIVSSAGITWRTPPQFLPEPTRMLFPDGAIELGVAHGLAGIIGMLNEFVKADLQAARCARMLERAICWLLSSRQRDAKESEIRSAGVRVRRDSLGWCNGSAGIGGVLLCVSSALGSKSLETTARALLQQTAETCARAGVAESGFCSGAAGLAHVYNAAFQRTHDPRLRQEAEYWISRLLELRKPGIGIAGYGSLKADNGGICCETDTKLITGVVGIALVLLAATEDQEPAWQRLFLL